LLRTHVPDDLDGLRKHLASEGIDKEQWSRLVHP
jgi:hypothetical protein